MKTVTTAKKFREGVKLSANKGVEIHWESTGHIHVQLLDASGLEPLAARTVTVSIPGEGNVELTSDDDGYVFHPDVPFQDYTLKLGDIEVIVPTVGTRLDVHRRHVAAIPFSYIQGVLYSAQGILLDNEDLEIEFGDGTTIKARTTDAGLLRCKHPQKNDKDATIRNRFGECKVKPVASPQQMMRLVLEAPP
jgi:hypothetical protein